MQESDHWYSIYGSQTLKIRRNKTYIKKYKRLGLYYADSHLEILDVCCGTGEFTNLIAEKNPNSLVIGIDIFIPPDIIKNHKNLFFFRTDSYNLCLPNNCFDIIFCTHSLHHLGEAARWNDLLSEFKRVLKPGGILYIIDHYPSAWLHLAFKFIKSPFGRIISWMKEFQKQLIDENQILKYWLKNWKIFFNLAQKKGFTCIRNKKGLFFFYANLKKNIDDGIE